MKRIFSWTLVFVLAGVSQVISAQTPGASALPEGSRNSGPVASAAAPAASIIPIGSSLTFGGTNAPDTYSATTTFSSTY